jgi:hypothetical protein
VEGDEEDSEELEEDAYGQGSEGGGSEELLTSAGEGEGEKVEEKCGEDVSVLRGEG